MAGAEQAKREWLVNTVAAMLRLPVDSAEDGVRWAQGLSDAVLEHLRSSSRAEVAKIYQAMRAAQNAAQQDPEIIAAKQRATAAEAERIWAAYFHRHPELKDCQANRQIIYNYALSLADDANSITREHLEEASKLPNLARQKVLTAAERNQQAAKDSETFNKAALQLGFSANTANEKLVKDVLGSGFSVYDIAQAISSNAIQLSRVGEAEQQQRDEKERCDLIGQILDDYAVDGDLREAKRHQLERPDITLDNLRQQVAVIRERQRLHEMTPAQIREENATRAAQQASYEKPINVAGSLHGLAKQNHPTMPDTIWHEGKEVGLDSVFLRRASTEQLKQLIKKFGDAQVVARLRQNKAVAVFGE
jgi:hypothetical protein